MSSDVVGSRCQEVGMRGNGVVSIAFCAPEGISLGVHVPVHEIRGVGVKRNGRWAGSSKEPLGKMHISTRAHMQAADNQYVILRGLANRN